MSVRAILVAAQSIPPFLVPDPGSGTYYANVQKSGPNGTPYNPGSGQSTVYNSQSGFWRRAATGDWYNTNFPNTNMNFWSGRQILQQRADTYVSFGNSVDRQTHYAMEWMGYIYVASTGTYDICLVSDDQSMMWIGDTAISGFTGANRHTDSVQQLNPNSLILTGGLWYPVRIWYNEIGGSNSMQMYFGATGIDVNLFAFNVLTTAYDGVSHGLNPNNYQTGGWLLQSEFTDFVEGTPQYFSVVTFGLIDGTTAYWTVVSQDNLDPSQFDNESGQVTIYNNQASFEITVNHSNSIGNPSPQHYTVVLANSLGGTTSRSNSLTINDYGPGLFDQNNTLIYFDAGNPSSYPGTGNTWHDLSQYHNDATLTNATYNSANGGYITFTSTGSGALNPALWNQTWSGKTVFVAGRFSDAPTQAFRAMVGSLTGNRNFNFYIHWDSTDSIYQLHYSVQGAGGFSNAITYTPGDWFVAAVTHDGSETVTFWFNNHIVGTTTGIPFYQYETAGDAFIGAADNHFDGDISVLAVYTVALTEQQIRANFSAIRGRYGL